MIHITFNVTFSVILGTVMQWRVLCNCHLQACFGWLQNSFQSYLKEVKVNPTKSGRVAKKEEKKRHGGSNIFCFFVVADNKSCEVTYTCDFTSLYILWHYRLWSFKTRDTKERKFFFCKNQRTQRKLMNSEIWTNGEPQ